MHILSFCILDDLNPVYGPIHKQIKDISLQEILKNVKEIFNEFFEGSDPTGYLHDDINENKINRIAQFLVNQQYYVINRYEKYYVIAFSLDYTRFEVFSKDCDKRLIKWRDDDSNDKIAGIINDPTYNESPVLKLMKLINKN